MECGAHFQGLNQTNRSKITLPIAEYQCLFCSKFIMIWCILETYFSGIPFWLSAIAHSLPHYDLEILLLAYGVLRCLHVLHLLCVSLVNLQSQKLLLWKSNYCLLFLMNTATCQQGSWVFRNIVSSWTSDLFPSISQFFICTASAMSKFS